jgi:hypothetical protein
MAAPPARACCTIAAICGPEISTATAAARQVSHSALARWP